MLRNEGKLPQTAMAWARIVNGLGQKGNGLGTPVNGLGQNIPQWPGRRKTEWARARKDGTMRKKFRSTLVRCMIPMNLQLFAGSEEGAAGGNEEDNPTGGGSSGSEETGGAADPDETKPEPSFDDFLKTGNNQAEFDRRVQRAIDKAVAKASESWRAETDNKVSEAEKLAKMTAAEKAQYQEQQRLKDLEAREAAIARRELMATAKITLADKGLPGELADILDYTNAEACNKSIEAVEKAINAGVEAGVKARLKGGQPMKKAPERDATADLKKQIDDAVKNGFF